MKIYILNAARKKGLTLVVSSNLASADYIITLRSQLEKEFHEKSDLFLLHSSRASLC
jgi:hypothetical protein